jgi:hypothetical protein
MKISASIELALQLAGVVVDSDSRTSLHLSHHIPALIPLGRRNILTVGKMIEERHRFSRANHAGELPRPRLVPIELKEAMPRQSIRLFHQQTAMLQPPNFTHQITPLRFSLWYEHGK